MKRTKIVNGTWMRQCNSCQEWKPLDTYAKRAIKDRVRDERFHRQFRCPECRRAYHLMSKYGLTVEQANALPKACEVCGRSEQLNVDHDHETGVVRGTLCNPCNRAIGLFRDDVDRLRRAIKYLSR